MPQHSTVKKQNNTFLAGSHQTFAFAFGIPAGSRSNFHTYFTQMLCVNTCHGIHPWIHKRRRYVWTKLIFFRNLNCTVTFEGPPDSHIVLNFIYAYLFYCDSFGTDYLGFYDGLSLTACSHGPKLEAKAKSSQKNLINTKEIFDFCAFIL